MRGFWIVVLSTALAASSADALAQGRGRNDNQETPASGTRPFDASQERIIRQWFSNSENLKGLPPGLAKRETLPPGLQRQLVRNGTLPPGLQSRVQPLPRDLEILLPRLPDGRRRVVIAGNIILLEERTAAIVDILTNIF